MSVEQNVSVLELAANSDVLSEDRFREGLAVDADLGLMWTPGWFVKSKKVAVKKMVKVRRQIAQEKPIEKPAEKPAETASTTVPAAEDLTLSTKTTSQTIEVTTKTDANVSTTTTVTTTASSETIKTTTSICSEIFANCKGALSA